MLRRLAVGAAIAGIVVVVLLAVAIWLVARGVQAAGHLSDLRDEVARVRADLLNGQDATADLRSVQADASAANSETHDPVWFLASWLPPVKTVRGIASVADDLAQRALPPVVQVGPSVQPKKLRIAHNQIALKPLEAAAPVLARADTATARARDTVAGLPGGWLGPISSARDKVLSQLTSLAGSVDAAARFARVGPPMLGADGPRRYFVGIQNNAETRPTGGLVAAYAIVRADHGRVKIVKRGNDGQLQPAAHPVVDLGKAYDQEYGAFRSTQQWITSNVSPDFPQAATIWAHLWQAQSGQHVDGAIAVDPVLLASLLKVTGPVTLPRYHQTFTGDNLDSFIESGQYQQFQNAEAPQRKNFVSRVAGAVLHRLLSGAGDPAALATALGHGAGGGHLQLWSAHPEEQAGIHGTPLAGELPDQNVPFAAASFINEFASKLDFYLDRSLTYHASGCSGATRQATITLRLVNAAPRQGLPAYVRNHDGPGGTPGYTEKIPREHLFVTLFTSRGAVAERSTLDGRPVMTSVGTDQGHRAFRYEVTLDPGVQRTIVLTVREPIYPGRPVTKVQPLFRPQQTRLDAPTCI